MAEIERYIQILIESLKKKIQILDTLLELNEQQGRVVAAGDGLEEFDRLMDAKGEQIELIKKLDIGFNAIYNRLKPELTEHPELHRSQIIEIQGLISKLTDRSVRLEASEKRNKQAVEQYFRLARKQLHTTKQSVQAVSNYYKSMTNTQYIDPQMINFKK